MFVKSKPNEEDWHSETWDMETPYAYERFNGKTHTFTRIWDRVFRQMPPSLLLQRWYCKPSPSLLHR